MPDFNEFGMELRHYLGRGSTDSASDVAARIQALGDRNLPPLFRRRIEAELEAYLVRAKEVIAGYGYLWANEVTEASRSSPVSSMRGEPMRETGWTDTQCGDEWYFKYDEDLFEACVSVSAIASVFGHEEDGVGQHSERELRDIMGGEATERRRRLAARIVAPRAVTQGYEAHNELVSRLGAALLTEKEALLDRLEGFFQARSVPGAEVPTPLHFFACAVSLGHPDPEWPNYIGEDVEYGYLKGQLKCDWELGLVEDEDVFLVGDEIRFKGLRREGEQLSLLLESDRGLDLVITPWFGASFYNNDFGVEIPASSWVNGESFKVTFERDGQRV